MRKLIWQFCVRNLPIGQILPLWALAIRTVLYPLETFYWQMSKNRGYNWMSDTWEIEGVRYSGQAMRMLAKAQGQTYKITCIGDTVTLELIK